MMGLLALSLWLVKAVLAAWAMELRKISTCCLSQNSNGDGSVFTSTKLGPAAWGRAVRGCGGELPLTLSCLELHRRSQEVVLTRL